MSNELEQTWRDEFDEMFSYREVPLNEMASSIKQFIESLLSKQKEEYSSDGRCIVCNYKKMLGIT